MGLDTSASILLGAAGVALSIVILAYQVGQVKSKLDGLDDVSKLVGQLQMLDISKAAAIPDNVETMRDDLDEVNENVQQIDGMGESISTIERSVTNIDFEGIERAVDSFVDGGLPTGNSVEYTLERADIDVVISLSSMDEAETKVNFRFEENVGAQNLVDTLAADEQLAAYEESVFGKEPGVYAISPRQIEAEVPSEDMEKIVEWAAELVDKFDETYIELRESKDEFDSLLEQNLSDKDR